MSSNPNTPTILSSILGGGSLPGPVGRIGNYRILSMLGEGGFGIVYLAEQTEPVRRRVALKIIKLGMDTAQVVARFDAERQALALMDHPNVAKVLDAGATEQGRPYFVMEYVPGEPLLSYCDKARLATRDRVELFALVCDAVQHAHHKGIVHRDLKPSNVLVELVDGRPTPKVIDFGISKAINQPLTQRTIFTEVGQMVGTPEYMSPEQAEMTGLNVDTRTDIYSLGVMLYEALTGSLPFDSETLRSVGLVEVHRIIREVDPPLPSARAHAQRQTVTFARLRRAEPATLVRQLRGDLDWITMRAMEKDRTRRYPSASEFAEDLRRFLRDEPVAACPPSAVYVLSKFVRRHRTFVRAASVAGLAVVLGVAAIAYAAVTSTRARDAMQRALESFQAAQALFIAPIEQARPEIARGRDPTLREFLASARANLPARSSDPLVLAAMQDSLGTTFLALGEPGEARPLLREALDTRRRLLGVDHPQTLVSAHRWAAFLDASGDLAAAESLATETHTNRSRVLGPRHRDTLNSADLLASILHHRALVARDEAERLALFGRARLLHERTRNDREQAFGPDDADSLDSRNNLAAVYTSLGSPASAHAEAAAVHSHAAAAWGPDHPKAINAAYNLGLAEWALAASDHRVLPSDSRWTVAMDRVRSASQAYARVLGPDHEWTLDARARLASMLADPISDLCDPASGVRMLDEVIAAHRRADPAHPACVDAVVLASSLRARLGQADLARQDLDLALSLLERRRVPATDARVRSVRDALDALGGTP